MTAHASASDFALQPHIKLVQTRHGPLFVMTTDESVSRSLIEYGEWTYSEIDLLQRILQPGDNAIDVGANIGTHAISLAKSIGPTGTVFAFEPQPEIFNILAANVLINGVNVRPIFGGCAGEQGSMHVRSIDYLQRGNFGAVGLAEMQTVATEYRTSGTPVQVFALDDVFRGEHLRLIKVDVEGMELEVLRGARRVIERHRPFLYVENEKSESSEALLRSILGCGYRAYWHVVPLYVQDNYNGSSHNPFGRAACINNFCVPAEMSFAAHDLTLVTDISEHPRSDMAARATTLNQKAAEVLWERAKLFQRERQSFEALALCDKALQMHRMHVGALVLRGHALRDLGNRDGALASYEQALSIAPDSQEAQEGRDQVNMGQR